MIPHPLTPIRFAQLTSRGRFQVPLHILLLQRFILKILQDPNPSRGIIELPVRHGKSYFLSQYLTPWYLLTHPHHSIILTGYGNQFASEWGQKARDIFKEYAPPLCNLHIHPKQQRSDFWRIKDHEGSMRTTGTLGSISGKGCHLLIGDDLIKDQQEANSPIQRDNIHKWFLADAFSRLEPNGKCILIQSRRHPDDIIGRLLKTESEGGIPWQRFRLPALCDDPLNDPLNRSIDDPLWPARYNKSHLLEIKNQLILSDQSHIWESLYQQNPLGDPLSREWPTHYLKDLIIPPDALPLPENIRLSLISLDPSKSKSDKVGDYSSFCHILLDNQNHIYVTPFLQRQTASQVVDQAIHLIKTIQPPPTHLIFESNMMQSLFGDAIHKETQRQNLPIQIVPFQNREDKIVRIRLSLTPLLANKRLHFLPSPSTDLMIQQLRDFPTATYDDGPDSLELGCQLINLLLYGKRPKPIPQILTV